MDEVDVGPPQLLQHLPGLGRQALHVFAVPFGIERVEYQRRFPRSARAGDYHQLPARQPHFEVLQVVLAGAFDVDVRGRLHGDCHQVTV